MKFLTGIVFLFLMGISQSAGAGQQSETFLHISDEQKSILKGKVQVGSTDMKDLPLVEVPSLNSDSKNFAVILSGDGGWTEIDEDLSAILAQNGIPVVGLNSFKYFWKAKTPDGSAKDLERIVKHYLTKWGKEKIILIGYSFGADVLPFMAGRMSKMMQERISLIALLSPEQTANFKFHPTEWLRIPSKHKSYPLLPEIERLRGKSILCFCGEKETNTLCTRLDKYGINPIIVGKGHHYSHKYDSIADSILSHIPDF